MLKEVFGMGFTTMIKDFFSPSDVVREEQHRRQHIFISACRVAVIVLSIFVIYYGLFDRSYNIIPMAVLLVIAAISFYLSKRGKSDLAPTVMVWSTLIGLFSLAAVNDGLYDTALMAIPALLLVAAMLLEKRHLIIYFITAIILLIAIGLFYVTHSELYPVNTMTSFTDIFDVTIINGATMILVMLISAYLSEGFIKIKQGETRLMESEERFRTLFDQSPDAYEVVDHNGQFVEVNLTTIRQLGYTHEEMLKMSIFDIDPEITPARFEQLQTRISSTASLRFESVHRRKDGSTFPVELSISSIHLNGTKNSITNVRDITKRKRAEDILRASEERYRLLANNVPDIIYSLDSEGNIVTVNNSAFERYGYTEQDSKGKPFFNFIHPEDREIVIKSFLKAREELREFTHGLQFRIVAENGFSYWFELNSHASFDGNDRYMGEDGVLRDITERKHAEEMLKENQRFLSEIIENNGTLIYVKDREGRYELVNKKWEETTGLKREFAIGNTDVELFPGEVGKKFRNADVQTMEHGSIEETEEEFEDATGKKYFISIKFPLRDNNYAVKGICGISTDITERKNAEEIVKSSELKLRTVADFTYDWEYWKNEKGKIVYMSPSCERITGYKRDEFISDTSLLEKIMHPDDSDAMKLHIKEVHSNVHRGQVSDIEFRILNKNGSIINIQHICRPVYDNHHEFLGRRVSNRDITERKLAEDAKRESEEKYRGLIEGSPDAIAIYVDGKIVYCNPAGVQLLGASNAEELLGKSVIDLVHSDYKEIVTKRMITMLKEGKTLPIAEEKFIRFDGSTIDVEVKANPIIYEKKPAVQVIVRDITERKRTEAEIEKMALMLSVAPNSITVHDFNGRFFYANQRTFDLHGYTKDEFMSLNLHEVDVPESEKRIAQRIKHLLEHGEARFEAEHFRKDRTIIPMEVYIQLTLGVTKRQF
jgi:PAS domain S-box-containing protein